MYVYAVREIATGKLLSKSVGNAYYFRQGDATKRANHYNRYHKTTKYEVVKSPLVWEVVT